MHKVVIDTNIFISALISKSYPYKIIYELILDEKVRVFTSSSILQEFNTVLSYPKFRKYPFFESEGFVLYVALESLSTIIDPHVSFSVLNDSSDNKFLESAFEANADFLITGNTKHFPFGKFHNTEIISPQKYWNAHWK